MSSEKESQRSLSPLLFLILVLMYSPHRKMYSPHWNLTFHYCGRTEKEMEIS
jgi:hypothetical protein